MRDEFEDEKGRWRTKSYTGELKTEHAKPGNEWGRQLINENDEQRFG